MAEITVNDYTLFENANKTTKTLLDKSNSFETKTKSVKTTITNDSVFQGPIAINCKEVIEKLLGDIANLNTDYSSFSTTLTKVCDAYKSGDENALAKLLELDASQVSGDSLLARDSVSMVDGTVNGQDYYVTDTKGGALDFAKHIDKDKVSEAKNPSEYNGHCLGFAFMNCWGLYTNNRKYTAADGRAYRGQSNFSQYTNDDKGEFLKKLYDELSNNKPTVVQVNGNKKGTSRHYVTVIGYKKSVKNRNDLTEKDLLIIDPYDGKLKTMDKAGSRFLVTGKQCGKKKYSGYQMYYIT